MSFKVCEGWPYITQKRLVFIPWENTVQSDQEHFLHFKGYIITMKLLDLNKWPWVSVNRESEREPQGYHYKSTQTEWPLLTPADEQANIECKTSHADFNSGRYEMWL